MSASVIGKFSTFNGAADAIRRTSPYATHNDDAIRPAAAAERLSAEARHRDTGITIDLRPDPPEDTAHEATKRAFERTGHDDNRRRGRGNAAAGQEPERTYRANPDTPFRRRTSEQTYQAVEAVDAHVSHRGGIYDRQI